MSPVLEQALLSKLHALPEERQDAYVRHFIEELDECMGSDDGFVLTDEQKAELDRRIAESDAHPERLIPAEVVFERLRARWSRS